METKNLMKKNIIITVILVIIAAISMFFVAKLVSSSEFHKASIESIEASRNKVLTLTAGAATASTTISLVPGDSTTPIANQIMDLSSYLIIVVCALFIEKFLITITGLVAFRYLIPIACLLYAIYRFVGKELLKQIAIKLVLFSIVIVSVIPVSIKLSDVIVQTHQESAEYSEQKLDKLLEEISLEAENAEDEGLVKSIITKIKTTTSGAALKCKETLNFFIDSIAVLIVTTCLIPIAVLMVMIFFIKMFFGINISLPEKPNLRKIKTSENTEI